MIEKKWTVMQGDPVRQTFCIVCKSTGEVLAYDIKNLDVIEKIIGWSSLTTESQNFLLEHRFKG